MTCIESDVYATWFSNTDSLNNLVYLKEGLAECKSFWPVNNVDEYINTNSHLDNNT